MRCVRLCEFLARLKGPDDILDLLFAGTLRQSLPPLVFMTTASSSNVDGTGLKKYVLKETPRGMNYELYLSWRIDILET
jgi:hypothetical protein